MTSGEVAGYRSDIKPLTNIGCQKANSIELLEAASVAA